MGRSSEFQNPGGEATKYDTEHKVWCKRDCALLLLSEILVIASPAQTLTVANFSGANGLEPVASLIQGTDGNFYGAASMGGAHGYGTIFKMSVGGTLTTLHSFDGTDGENPMASLIQAIDGNLYGTTYAGGANPCPKLPFITTTGCGTIFRITTGGTLTVLHSFCAQSNCTDGKLPLARLVQGTDGNFYGTTNAGGASNGCANGCGTIFKMTLGGAVTTLHSFDGTDGANPKAGLIQATDGNLYGTTYAGGANGNRAGTIFKISPGGTLVTLYNFSGNDGSQPIADLIQATDRNFYGTTYSGGMFASDGDGGTIFKITPNGMLTTLYSFCAKANCTDGRLPLAGLVQGTDGNFYGTTNAGGDVKQEAANGTFYTNSGTVFEITPKGVLTTLHSFAYNDTEGSSPSGALIQATDGNFFGTAEYGGSYPSSGLGGGTVFRLGSTLLPTIAQSGAVLNGASFQAGVVPNSWITVIGTNLSPKTDTWANAIKSGDLPTSVDGVSVILGGKPAYISYISPTQINALAPNVGSGVVSVTVTNSAGTSSAATALAQMVQPAFFQWDTYAVATRQDYSLAVKNGILSGPTVPAKPGDIIILWGTGFGPTTPAAPTGLVVPSSRIYQTSNQVTVTVGGMPTTVYGAALAPGYAGLYQVAIQIPTLLGNGDYPVIATVSGAQSPITTLITVQR